MGESFQTHDHQKIKEWAGKRKGEPAKVAGSGSQADVGLIRIHFPEKSQHDELQKISWEDFFDEFEKNQLDFIYQEKKEGGELSTFHKLIHRGD
ncbi:MAG: hypothetical protein ACNS62_11610 [Candidatus Cyclobacteriaceae bacterium M3_2C_046]